MLTGARAAYSEYAAYSPADLAESITQLTSVIGGLTGSFTALVNAAPLASSLAGNASRVGQMLEFMDGTCAAPPP